MNNFSLIKDKKEKRKSIDAQKKPIKLEEIKHPIIWYFPRAEKKKNELGKKTSKFQDLFLVKVNKTLVYQQINNFGYIEPNECQHMIKSSQVKAPFCVRFNEMTFLSYCFTKKDLQQLPENQKRFFPLQKMKSKLILPMSFTDDNTESEKLDFNMNYFKFMKALYSHKNMTRGKDQNLPILLFINCRLIHGLELVATANSIFLPLTDNTHSYTNLYFNNLRIADLPLETRIQFEISLVYNTGHLNRLAVVSTSLFDSHGILRTGKRVSKFSPYNFSFCNFPL